VDFYRDRFADAGDFTFVLVGALDVQGIRPLVETYLGSLPALDREESWRDLDIDPPAGVVKKTVRKGLEPQSRTQILFTGPFEWTAENRLGMRLMTAALEIRLREVIREDLSGTYGVSVSGGYEKFPEETFTVGISFGADPDRIEELSQAVFEEIRKFQDEGPTQEDVQKVTEQERRDRETNLRENGWWASQLRFADQYGADPRFLLDMSLLEGASVATIQRDARRYLRTDNYVQVTLMPETGEPGRP
jgi:zinc protease